MKHYADDWLTIYQGDVRAVLPELASDSVDCIVTSPPYWGLRDYGTATWEGGSADCDHRQEGTHVGPKSTLRSDGRQHTGPYDGEKAVTEGLPYKHICGKCGAVRQDVQLGLERTPEEYVANLVSVFRELRRVLKPSGTAWMNLGDSYASSPPGNKDTNSSGLHGAQSSQRYAERLLTKDARLTRPKLNGLKPKDLVGIPWRVAFALQADGWYLRSDIIWSKPNPMPESVTDRPTKAHEYLFLLTKSARYYYDADAVREAQKPESMERYRYPFMNGDKEQNNGRPGGAANTPGMKLPPEGGRSLRSVWTIATRPYPGAHFAVFPPELPERCIKAGSSERGVCPECGAPWERRIEVESRPNRITSNTKAPDYYPHAVSGGVGQDRRERTDLGWQPACRHEALKPQPAVVLDPFAGSGTTGMVANRLSRRAILIDLNGDYLKQQLQRNAQTPLGLGA